MHQPHLLPDPAIGDVMPRVHAQHKLYRREGVEQLVGQDYRGAGVFGRALPGSAFRRVQLAAFASDGGRQRAEHGPAAVHRLGVAGHDAEAALALAARERRGPLHDKVFEGCRPPPPHTWVDAELVVSNALLDVVRELPAPGTHLDNAEGRALLQVDPFQEQQPAHHPSEVRRKRHRIGGEVSELLSGLSLLPLVEHAPGGIVPKIVAVLSIGVKLVHAIELLCVHTAGEDVHPTLRRTIRQAAMLEGVDASPTRGVATIAVCLDVAAPLVAEVRVVPAIGVWTTLLKTELVLPTIGPRRAVALATTLLCPPAEPTHGI
mmetsp:Transcript_121688/g.351311  ORF Transcript_121688/g.351311 Transcript_121688/m.351311 type:complete len:319 (+) Transcript_121688:1503-2459(+)